MTRLLTLITLFLAGNSLAQKPCGGQLYTVLEQFSSGRKGTGTNAGLPSAGEDKTSSTRCDGGWRSDPYALVERCPQARSYQRTVTIMAAAFVQRLVPSFGDHAA